MALFMNAYVVSGALSSEVDFPDAIDVRPLYSWTQHACLQDWFDDLYYRKGGQHVLPYRVNLALTLDDLDHLETSVRTRTMPNRIGSLARLPDTSNPEHDLAFIAMARAEIERGNSVYLKANH